jgi:hypothetical protein
MGFSVMPYLSISSLRLGGGVAGDANLGITNVAAGKTLTGKYPLYLEGSMAYMTYQSEFGTLNSKGESATIQNNWSSLAGTAGLGYDFELTPNLVVRPILKLALGRLDPQFEILGQPINPRADPRKDLDNFKQLNAVGIGGAVELHYNLKRDENQYDADLRYTNLELKTFNSSPGVTGRTNASALSFLGRYRTPTGATLMDRSVRYVFEVTSALFLGDQRYALGFNSLNTVGFGFELDTRADLPYDARTRLVARYAFGDNVQGFSIGLAFSF